MIKPDGVRLGQAGDILRSLGDKLKAAGVNFRFVAPLLVEMNGELTNHIYFEHTGQLVEGLDKPGDKKPWFAATYGRFINSEAEEMLKSPPIAVMIEAEMPSVEALITAVRDAIGATNPLKEIREHPEQAAAQRDKIRYAKTTGSGRRIEPLPGTENVPVFNMIHCPTTPFEAKAQLRALFRAHDLAGYYTKEEIAEILGSPYPVKRRALPLSHLSPAKIETTAQALKNKKWHGFRDTHPYEVELLLREFGALEHDLNRLEYEFDSGLGLKPENQPPAPAPRPRGRLFLVAGPSAVGKSTAARTAQIDALLPQYITPASKSSEPEEKTALTKESATALLSANFFLALQQGYDGVNYLIPGGPLERFARYHGGRMLGFVSEDHIQAIQAWAVGHPELSVHTAHLSIPREAEAELLRRLVQDPERNREDRIEATLSICRGLEARSATFERRIDASGSREAIVADLNAWFAAVEAGQFTAKTLPAGDIDTPRALFIRQVILNLMDKLTYDVIPEGGTDIYSLAEKAGPQIRQELATLYYEVFRQQNGRPPETKEDLATLESVTEHVLNTVLSVLHSHMPFEERTAAASKLTRLTGASTEPERMMANLEAIDQLAQAIPLDEALMLAILHDLGKTVGFYNHSQTSGSIVGRLKLPARFGADNFIPAEDLAIDEAVISHHHVIGNTFIPDCSLRMLLTLFEDQKVVDLIWDGTTLNVGKAEKLLARLLFLTVADVAGKSSDGFLFNLDLEKYRESYEIALTAVRTAKSPEEIIQAIKAEAENPARNLEQTGIALAMLAGEDMDIPAEGLKHFAGFIAGAAEQAIAAEQIKAADWNLALRKIQHIRESSYFLSAHLVAMKPGSDEVTDNYTEEVGVTFLKYQIARAKMAAYIQDKLGRDTILSFTDQAGKMRFDAREISVLLNRVLSGTGTDVELEADGSDLYLLGADGRRIEGLVGTITATGNTTAALQIKLG
jgi:nucleoside diphosphate kinase